MPSPGSLRLRWNAGVLLLVLAATGVVHLVMEPIASWAEDDPEICVWRNREWMGLFRAANHEHRGRGRILMYGPSESREAFLGPRIRAGVGVREAYQCSQNMGTLDSCNLLAEYIERTYGRDALPEILLVGITTRFVANIRHDAAPMLDAIDAYSPAWRVDRARGPSALEAKSPLASIAAWCRLRAAPQPRYYAGLRALGRELLMPVAPSLANSEELSISLSRSKYHHLPPRSAETIQTWLRLPDTFWKAVHEWDPDAAREQVLRDFRRLRGFAAEHGIELYVVNMPEISYNRRMYPEGRYERYLAVVREGLADTPFLDLRLFLADGLFYDTCHPTRAGSERVSDRVAAFIARHRAQREGEVR